MKKLLTLALASAMVLTLLVGCAPSAAKPTKAPDPAGTTAVAPVKGETTWPEKPVNVIIPYGPGGDTDFNTRAFLPYLTKELGQPFVGTNVEGSSGTIASRQVKDSAADGYNILFSHTAMNVNEMVGIADFGMDNFEIACIAGRSPGEIITMRADSGIKTLDELKKYTEAHPNELDLAINFGTMVHINGVQMQDSGIAVNLIDAGGATERVAALAGGHCDIIINAYGNVKDYLESGEFVALSTNGTERSSGFPDIPTAKESGYNIFLDKHYFFAFPKGTDAAIVEKFAAAIEKITADPDYQADIMKAYRQDPFYASTADGLEMMKATKDQIWTFKDKMGG
ncbi:MAG: tripartite tricarboxylate transporter substrate binding protein [Pseudoflavonifractor sp.]